MGVIRIDKTEQAAFLMRVTYMTLSKKPQLVQGRSLMANGDFRFKVSEKMKAPKLYPNGVHMYKPPQL